MSDHLLPPNSTALERDMASTIARLSDIPVLVKDVWNPDTCPIDVLPWLAWALSVDEWDSNWTDAQKRATVKASIAVHKYKGTIGAVEEALAALGFGAQVQEWFNQTPDGDPYTFKLLLEVDQVGVDLAGLLKAIAVVMSAKNLRSHLDSFDLTVRSNATLYAASAVVTGNDITLNYDGQVEP
jgi:phage tail P2-like protein